MRIFPVVIDSMPSFLAGAGSRNSLLQLPVGDRTLLSELYAAVSSLSATLTVIPTFAPPEGYSESIAESIPDGLEAIQTSSEVVRRLSSHEPSDVLLIIDPRCYPATGFDPEGLVKERGVDPRWVSHLVTLQATSGSAEECVELGEDGGVERIQRYYRSVTWPLTSGHFCTMLPVACTLRARSLPLSSLGELRTSLAGRGVPSRDVLLAGGAFDLTQERGVLGLMEQSVTNVASSGRTAWEGARVSAGARFLGPVHVLAGAVVEEGATVVQALVAPGAQVPEGAVVRHRVWGPDGTRAGAPEWLLQEDVDDGRQPLPALVDDGGTPKDGAAYPALKRLADACLALFGLVVLSPLLLLIAAMVKLTSPGPILYGDEREGRQGRRFRCWKFRTMVRDANILQRRLARANKVDGPQFKMDDDPRVTSAGRWLRPTNLDELPQLLNVLLGHMSFVGPRPSPFRENQMCIPWRTARLSVRPGITGLWQVCRHERSAGDFHQWIQYDLLYVRNLSLLLDLKIFLATLATFGGRSHVPLSWILPPEKTMATMPLLTDLG